jgi:hypothetical protein
MFNSDTLANRPAAGIVGRIFIAIDSPFGIYRDTGTAWDQISSVGVPATTIYNGDGTLTGTRTISSGGFQLVFNPQTTFSSSLTASTGASSFSVLGSNALTFAAAFSSSNIGNVYGANGAINAQNFLGNATFAQANLASAMVNVNKIDFGSGGHTITMTQSTAPGIRAMTGVQNQIQFTGSHNGTISNAAISQNLGFFRETGSTRTLTISNAYSLLLNPLDDYGAGFTFTNRWGIYQAGASDKNYFAANSLFGTTTDAGFRVDINGNARISGELTAGGSTFNGRIIATQGSSDSGGIYYTRAFSHGTTPALSISAAVTGNASTDLSMCSVFDSFGFADIATRTGNYLSITSGRNPGSFEISTTGTINFINLATDGASKLTNSSTGTYNAFNIGYRINRTGAGIMRGFYYNPIIDNLGGSVHNAIQTTSGNIVFNGGFLVLGNTSVNASAIIQADSTTRGFLPPRMTNAQRIAIVSPAVGLIVYCTDAVEGLYVNKSTGWTFII